MTKQQEPTTPPPDVLDAEAAGGVEPHDHPVRPSFSSSEPDEYHSVKRVTIWATNAQHHKEVLVGRWTSQYSIEAVTVSLAKCGVFYRTEVDYIAPYQKRD